METADVSHLWDSVSTPSVLINLNLPHIMLMWGGGLLAAPSHKTGNKDETVRERRSQNRDRMIIRTQPGPEQGGRGLLLVLAMGLSPLRSSALDPVCPALPA